MGNPIRPIQHVDIHDQPISAAATPLPAPPPPRNPMRRTIWRTSERQEPEPVGFPPAPVHGVPDPVGARLRAAAEDVPIYGGPFRIGPGFDVTRARPGAAVYVGVAATVIIIVLALVGVLSGR
jgi:hypothetical protein